jgi:hypothetical protein
LRCRHPIAYTRAEERCDGRDAGRQRCCKANKPTTGDRFMMTFSLPNALTFLAVLSPFLLLSLVIVLGGKPK